MLVNRDSIQNHSDDPDPDTLEQALHPDEEVTRFFAETAERCKSQLISDYINFIQQKSPTSISGEMNVKLSSIQWGSSPTE